MKTLPFYIIVFFLSFYSCQQAKHNSNITVTKSEQNAILMEDGLITEETSDYNPIYFKAFGKAPDWLVTLNKETITFSIKGTTEETFDFPISEPILAADANIKLYRMHTDAGNINLEIKMQACTQSDSLTYPYQVKVELKRKTDETYSEFNGCGEYIADSRLHDLWALESIKGQPIQKENFKKEIPRMEINATEKAFSGFAGCNTMRGSIFTEISKIRFTNIITTRMLCPPTNKETEFLKALQSSTQFKIENNRLYLSNPSTETLIFKKVD